MRCRVFILFSFLAISHLYGQKDDSGLKVGDSGGGFVLSSDGQTLFFYRGTAPFKLYQALYTIGIHQEEPGLAPAFADPFGNPYRNPSQEFYIELGLGGRRLLFLDKIGGGLFPYVTTELGASGYLAQIGFLRTGFRETSIHWGAFWQAGAGAAIHAANALYRFEMGYLQSYYPKDEADFPPYKGVYLKMIVSSGSKPRR